MLLTPDAMRWLLFFGLFGMALLAGLYLRGRSLTRFEYIVWALVIVLAPLLGPFITILAHPGKPRRKTAQQ